jgi:hypothetical protein
VGVTLLQALPSNYSSALEYYDLRAALVLEEACYILSETLEGHNPQQHYSDASTSQGMQKDRTCHITICQAIYGGLYKNLPPAFMPQELYDMQFMLSLLILHVQECEACSWS